MTPKAMLEQVRELLSVEDRWGQGQYKLPIGRHYCYCLTGALIEVTGPEFDVFNVARLHLQDRIVANGYPPGIARFNDSVDYKEMRRILDDAIETAPDVG